MTRQGKASSKKAKPKKLKVQKQTLKDLGGKEQEADQVKGGVPSGCCGRGGGDRFGDS